MLDAESLGRIALAFDLAARAHEGQRRRDGRRESFVSHVADVARRVSESPEVDEVTLTAALLHDVAEKTAHRLSEIEQAFGEQVADVVAELTDDESLPRKERHRQQVARAPAMSLAAKRVKLADKASKLASIRTAPPRWWARGKARHELAKSREVADALRGTDATLESNFDREANSLERIIER